MACGDTILSDDVPRLRGCPNLPPLSKFDVCTRQRSHPRLEDTFLTRTLDRISIGEDDHAE
jgi:hypothetical protein